MVVLAISCVNEIGLAVFETVYSLALDVFVFATCLLGPTLAVIVTCSICMADVRITSLQIRTRIIFIAVRQVSILCFIRYVADGLVPMGFGLTCQMVDCVTSRLNTEMVSVLVSTGPNVLGLAVVDVSVSITGTSKATSCREIRLVIDVIVAGCYFYYND